MSENQISSFREIDLTSLLETKLYTLQEKSFASRSSYTKEGDALIFLIRTNQGLSFQKLDLTTKTIAQITPWTSHIIDAPRVRDGYVYYTASFSGIDNIYRTPLDGSQRVEQLTSVKIGAYAPDISPDGQELVFTEHTQRGTIISKMDLGEPVIKDFAIVEPSEMQWQDKVAAQAEGGDISDRIPQQQYGISEYNKLFRGLKLHSWGLTPSTSSPAANLTFNNYLNDASFTIAGGNNKNEGGAFLTTEFAIAKWYPVITLTGKRNNREADYLTLADTLGTQEFNETVAGVNVSLPFNWIKGNYSTSLSIDAGANHHSTSNIVAGTDKFPSTSFDSWESNLDFSIIKRTARQNLGSKLGISSSISYQRNLKTSDNEKTNISSVIYLPGLSSNHSFRVFASYQKEPLSNSFQFNDEFEYVRGFETPINDEFIKYGGEYQFPLIYPDWGFKGIAYFKRISANLFYEYGEAQFNKISSTTSFQSTGIELIFDTTLLNLVPLDVGIRGSYLLNEDPNNRGVDFVSGVFFSISL